MVINIDKALGGNWDYVADEIRQVNDVVVKHGAILKVIFENDYLDSILFVIQANGMYSYQGGAVPHLKLMRSESDNKVQIKAAGVVRTLDDLLRVMSLGVTRIGATATVAIMEEAVRRGIRDQPTKVQFKPMADSSAGGY
ncbi:hypothetical protein DER46DRAFT_659255 [Fusarium sp. MPI-SDFR-AT-0072]|nr:hypothetical protein DER46DRAFT_659255 [Fusarium sp. MPI-SDFR-AT-0072]